MPVLPPISVTQSTAPSANAGTATNASAWADALASTQTPPQNSASPPVTAPAAPKQTASNKNAPNGPPAVLTSDTNELPVQLGKTAKAAKPQIIDTTAQPSKDIKKATQQTAVVMAPGMPAQPAPQKLAAPVNEKPQGDLMPQTHQTASVAANAINTTNATTSNQTMLNSNDMAPKPGTAISAAPEISTAAADQTTPKAQPLAPPAPPATNAQAGVAELASATTSGARASTATMQSAGTISGSKAAAELSASQLASQPVATSTAQAMTARATQLSETMTVVPKEKAKPDTPAVTALGGASATGAEFSVSSTGNTATQSTARVERTSTAPAALAATVTALHQSGQAGTVLRLDPPGLGHLSVEVRLGAQGQVNVMFVPSTADAAQALQASLPGLASAMAQSGLTLGQAQVGGQFSQQSGQNGQSGYTPTRQNNAPSFSTEPQTTPSGLSAYA
ncbi:MAG: flagellar hook-length control protein FliK [Rhodospirillales bacterium]|nr:flagellar hook-length control protein FliK [Rhodospirillales bacterium]